MRSICSILGARGFYSLLALVFCAMEAGAQQNYSLWPRRPDALAKAQILAAEGRVKEAEAELAPLLGADGIVGKEARETLGKINIRLALNPKTCGAQVYTVKRGDTWIGLSNRMNCPLDYLMHLNQLFELKGLQVGQKLLVGKLDYRIEVHLPRREVSLWKGDSLVNSYPIVMYQDMGKANASTAVSLETGVSGGMPVKLSSPLFPAADKTIVMGKGDLVIGSSPNGKMPKDGYYLKREDCNELSLLVRPGNEVKIIRNSQSPKS